MKIEHIALYVNDLENAKQFFIKLVDCLEKRLIYRHIRRFAD